MRVIYSVLCRAIFLLLLRRSDHVLSGSVAQVRTGVVNEAKSPVAEDKQRHKDRNAPLTHQDANLHFDDAGEQVVIVLGTATTTSISGAVISYSQSYF